MDLRPGNKQTEVGVIPEGWDTRPLLNAVHIATGQVDPRQEPYKSMILVAPDHIEGGTGRLLEQRTAAVQGAISGKYLFAPGDIVYSKIRPYLRKATLTNFQGLCSADMYPLTPAMDVSAAFVLAVLLGHHFSAFAAANASARSGIPKVNREELAQYVLALPPLAEQHVIARALGDVDALIGSLTQLIAKKRDVKQAAMQQLLTGQQRLSGSEAKKGLKATEIGLIPEDWDISTFGDLFNITAGGDVDPKRSKPFQDEIHCYPIYSNALTNYGLYGYCSYADHQAGSITITARGTLGFANFRDHAYSAIGRVLVLQPRRAISGGFFAEIINNRLKFAIESTGVPQLTAPQISTYRLPIPALPEQTAIAAVLSDMDAELEALEKRLAKTRVLKQGMMQELLTGRTRLV